MSRFHVDLTMCNRSLCNVSVVSSVWRRSAYICWLACLHYSPSFYRYITNRVFTRSSKHPANFQQMYSKYTC